MDKEMYSDLQRTAGWVDVLNFWSPGQLEELGERESLWGAISDEGLRFVLLGVWELFGIVLTVTL